MANPCPVVHLSHYRHLPRPRFQATVGGAVSLTIGTGEHEREEWLDLPRARELLDELGDAILAAEWLVRVGKEAEGG